MIEIEIDYNNDCINIKDDNLRADKQTVYSLNVTGRMSIWEKFFQELFNRLGASNSNIYNPNEFHVKLTLVDEDNRTLIDEW